MKYFLYSAIAFFALSLAALLGGLSLKGLAEDEPEAPAPRYGLVWEQGQLSIRFPEPVVPLSVVDNTRHERGTAVERGLDLFTVSGSPAPTLRWVDQDELRVDFAPGSSSVDSFRLDFKPGLCYLGGKPVAPASYTFSPRPLGLRVQWLRDYAGGAALLSAVGADTREAKALTQRHEGLRVRFRRMRQLPFAGWVGTSAVPATLRPATFADGTAGDEEIARALLGQGAPADIRPDTPLPQTLIALPARPLVPGAQYRVEIEADPASGFAGFRSIPVQQPRELAASLENALAEAEGGSPSRPRLHLRFDAPVAAEALRSLWSRLAVKLGGQPATLSEDGQCYRARVGGREVSLRLLGQLPLRHACELGVKEQLYRVALPGCAAGLEMELQASAPLEVAMELPRDFRAAHGLAPRERSLALPVLPAWPHWTGTGNVVPLHGSHLLRLPALNTGEVSVSLHHWDAGAAARLFPLIRRVRRDDSPLLELCYRLGWLRQKTDLWLLHHLGHARTLRCTAEALREVQADRLAQRALRRRVLAEGRAFAPVTLKQEGQADAFAARGDILLDLDAAAGGAGNLRPGLYLVRLATRPSATVQGVLASLPLAVAGEEEGGTDEPLCCQVEYLVQVTDIDLHQGGGYLFANSLSTGEPLRGVQATAYEGAEEDGDDPQPARATGCRLDLPQGAARLVPEVDEKLLLVQRGEDYRLDTLPDRSGWHEPSEGFDEPPLRMELFCDRPLYRPGERVHLRGVLRDMSGGLPALPKPGEVQLTIRRPGGELLETQSLTPDAYGAVTAEFRLPEGDEDVMGSYRCELAAGGESVSEYVSCEHFRRDAFELELEAEAAEVAPRELLVRVRARNYDGTALAGARVKLDIRAIDEIILPTPGEKDSIEVQAVGLGISPRFARRELELTLDGEGRAEYRLGLAPLPLRDEGCEGWVFVYASAANERGEWVRKGDACSFHPADFRIDWNGSTRRLYLRDAVSGEPLARGQKLELCVRPHECRWVECAPGIAFRVRPGVHVLGEESPAEVEPLLPVQEITVPANCRSGLDLSPLLAPLEGRGSGMRLELEGRDAKGRQVRLRRRLHMDMGQELPVDFALRVEGGELCVTPAEDWGGSPLHAFIGSQDKLRHGIAEPGADGSLRIPLRDDEFGDIKLTLLRCRPGVNGSRAWWSKGSKGCSRPRPDKQLAVELSLPQGAGPGEPAAIAGRVTDAAGRPQRAGVTLFAVDAGMLSVASYSPPELTCCFYGGRAPHFALGWQRRSEAARPALRPMGLAGWGLPDAEARGLWEHWHHWGIFGGIGSGSNDTAEAYYARTLWRLSDIPPAFLAYVPGLGDGLGEGGAGLGAAGKPRPRRNFAPVALWQGCVETAEDGSFRCPFTLPDTLTTYRVFALALGADGSSFGQAEGEFLVSQPLMLTPGAPFYMSLGDSLQLPLTITNNSGRDGQWTVALEDGGATPQQQSVQLAAGETKTLFFALTAQEEGERLLRWTATGEAGGDAVEARFPVLYPAPLLKEHHRFVLEAGETLDGASLLAEELAGSTRGSLTLEYATSPLLHLRGAFDCLLDCPYGCTEQRAGALLPWLFHGQLAPYCPQLGQVVACKVEARIRRGLADLLARQQADGGLAYWGCAAGEEHASSPWASAYAGLVLTLAQELGHEVPAEAMVRLRDYLGRQPWKDESPLLRYAAARTRGDALAADAALADARRGEARASTRDRGTLADLRFIAEVRAMPAERHEALLRWLRSQGRDYRHASSWRSGWQLIALGEYLRHEMQPATGATLVVDGEALPATAAPARLERSSAGSLAAAAPKLAAQQGRVYVTLRGRAQPTQADYPGVTERGLQVTRVYETQGADGIWRESRDWKVGEVVRVTLTCAKVADELEYLVLEDKLPSCLEAINPHVPGQAAGIEGGGHGMWSACFDHREYLPDRVRGFCTRWPGRELLNMRYYTRVKRAGEAIAPPAGAQLLYEPQCYGLSPSARVRAAH